MLVIFHYVLSCSYEADARHEEDESQYEAGGNNLHVVSVATMIYKIVGANYKRYHAQQCKYNANGPLFHSLWF